MSNPEFRLRLTDQQYRELKAQLFPGDGLEAIALVLCGRRESNESHIFTAREVVRIPYDECQRRADAVTWPLKYAEQQLARHYGKRQALIKVHSHSADYRRFSPTDDASDRTALTNFEDYCGDGLYHGSAIMLPDGSMFGRVSTERGFKQLAQIAVVGDDLLIWPERRRGVTAEFTLREAQAFGEGTVDLLRSMTVGVVGCSGTGSFVVEQSARLGFRKLVLVDPDKVEEKNLNRIVNASKEDAYLGRYKVHVMASAIARMGLGQEVLPLAVNVLSREAVFALAACDIIFGCMDGVEGRNLLNRLCTFYLIPYFDVGVKLQADGQGGIQNINGTVHYLQPGKSSLFSRGMYDMEQVRAEGLRRVNPAMYEEQRRQGYVRGVAVDRPAVISVNAFFAALAVNDMLARLHPYRNLPNGDFATILGDLTEVRLSGQPEAQKCEVLHKYIGRGISIHYWIDLSYQHDPCCEKAPISIRKGATSEAHPRHFCGRDPRRPRWPRSLCDWTTKETVASGIAVSLRVWRNDTAQFITERFAVMAIACVMGWTADLKSISLENGGL